MTLEDARLLFEEWYESCLENGISPEDVVSDVGGMQLITDEEMICEIEKIRNLRL